MDKRWIVETFRKADGALVRRAEYQTQDTARRELERCVRHFAFSPEMNLRMGARMFYEEPVKQIIGTVSGWSMPRETVWFPDSGPEVG